MPSLRELERVGSRSTSAGVSRRSDVSVAIQAHPSRAAFIPYLRRHLGADVPVAWDERSSVWDTWRRAAELRNPGATWHVTIQDDALIGAGFYPRLEAMLDNGHLAYCLFFRTKNRHTHGEFNAAGRAGRADGGFSWPRMQFAVGMVLHTGLLPELIEFCDGPGPWPGRGGDDPRIDVFLRRRGIPVWYPLPALVSHRRSPSIVGGDRGPNRVATWFQEAR